MEGANAYALREEEERHLAQQQQLRPARSENRSTELRGAWASETQRVAQESEQVANMLGQLAEIIDGHDAPLDTILDTADDTVGTLLDGTEAVGEKGKADAARTHKRNLPLAVGAVSGIVGAVTLTPILGALTGAAGAAVGYGVGTKVSGAIADSIDSELQVARDIAENDGVDRGPLVATDTLEWRWGDVGIGKLAESNPLRWASGSPAAILRDLRSRSEKEQLRPVVLRWKRAGRDSSATFGTVRETVRWIEDTLAGRRAAQASASAPNPALAQHASGGRSKSAAATELAGEFGQNEHLQRAVRHAARAGDTIAEIVPRLAVQGEKVDRAHSKASAAEGVIAAASRANKSRTVLGAMGAAWAGPARELGGSVSASTARQKPVWIRSHQAPICMLCEKEFGSGGGKHHCRYCGWAVCTACSLHTVAGLERWLQGDKPHAICHTRSTEALRVCDGCFDYHFPPAPLPSVSIPTAVCVGESRNAIYFYVLKVTADQASVSSAGQWGVVRRYSQFEALRTKILSLTAAGDGMSSALSDVEFPPKTSWFAGAAEVVAERRLGLGHWLTATRAVLMAAKSEEPGMIAAVREMRQFVAVDDSIQELGPGPAEQVSASLGVLRPGNGGRGGPSQAGRAGVPDGHGRRDNGCGVDVLDQLGEMVSTNLGAVKAIQKEGKRQNKLLGATTEATDRGRDGVGGMLDTYVHHCALLRYPTTM